MYRAYRTLAATALFSLLLVSGCADQGPAYVDKGASYDSEGALSIADSVAPGALGKQQSSQAAELRHKALVSLRSKGDGASEAAALITRSLPSNTNGVPFYVERMTFKKQHALVVVEAIGRKGGTLEDERVWVLSDSGEVLLSGTR